MEQCIEDAICTIENGIVDDDIIMSIASDYGVRVDNDEPCIISVM